MAMRPEFIYDSRLGIYVPELLKDWEQYDQAEREEILEQWEAVRGSIPSRVMELEALIMSLQKQMDKEDEFPTACQLNFDIAELASVINDLHIWYRVSQDIDGKRHLG